MRKWAGPWLWYGIALVVIALDLATKKAITQWFEYEGQYQVYAPFFRLGLHYNHGAAFSFLSDAGGWQRWFFTAIAGAVSLGLIYWLAKLDKNRWLEGLALALILGGALGNLYDRITLGYVVDFLIFHWQEHYFPAFNLADSAICGGAGLILLDAFLQRDQKAASV